MGEVKASIYIEAPVEEVFAFVADYRNTTRYLFGFTRFEPVNSIKYGLGAKVLAAGTFHGVPVYTHLEIVEFVPNRKIVSRSSPSVLGTPAWLFEPRSGGTVVTFASDFRLPFPVVGRLLGGLVLDAEVTNHVRESLRKLKGLIESQRAAKSKGTEGKLSPQAPDA